MTPVSKHDALDVDQLGVGSENVRSSDDPRARAFGVRSCPPCDGRCNQGRDCPAELSPRAPMTRRDGLTALALVVGSWVIAIGLLAIGTRACS